MSVDDFWRQLNVKKNPAVRLSGLTEVPGLTRQSRTLPAKSDQVSLSQAAAPATKPAVTAVHTEHQQLQATVQRDVNCLTDQDRNLRCRALSQLHHKLFSDMHDQSPAHLQQLQHAVCGPLLVNLARLMADPVEKCREGALALLTNAAKRLPEPAAMLSSLMPVLVARMGDIPVVEPSEELRLGLIDLIAGPVITRCGQHLAPYMGIIAQVVCRSLEDAFHNIKKAGCTAIARLCDQVPKSTLESQHEQLLASLLPNLSHQHSRVRSATLTALDTLVEKGVREEVMIATIAPSVRPLVSDRAAGVKEQCFAALANWLGASRNEMIQPADTEKLSKQKLRSYLIELLPVLLLGLTDETASIRRVTMDRLQAISQYQSDVQDDSVDKGTEERSMSNDHASTSQTNDQWPGSFTQPYQACPPASVRNMVEEVLPAILPVIVSQLRDWTVQLRLNAARSLQSALLFAGPATSQHLPRLLGPLCSAAGDEDCQVAAHVVQAAQVIGAFVQLSHWLPLMLDAVAAPQASLTTRVNALVVLAAMLFASGVVHQDISNEHLSLLVQALCSDAVRNADQEPAQQQLLAVIYNTISLAGRQCQVVSQQLWLLLLQLQGSHMSSALSASASQASLLLAEACGMQSSADLAAQHAPALISQLVQSSDSWTSQSPDCHVFSVLLKQCPGATLETLVACTLGIAAGILQDPEREPALQVHMLQLLETILANQEQAAAFTGAASPELCSNVLLRALVWRAGKAAAAVRFAAITALSTLFAQRVLQPDQVQELLQQEQLLRMLFQSLEEEYFVETRLTACSAFYHVISSLTKPLTPDQGRLIYPEFLKRLDDSSNQVRASICTALAAFCHSCQSCLDDTNMCYLITGVLIHMDDTDQVIQEAVCSVMEVLAGFRPKLVTQAVNKVQQLHRSDTYTSRVLLVCRQGIAVTKVQV